MYDPSRFDKVFFSLNEQHFNFKENQLQNNVELFSGRNNN